MCDHPGFLPYKNIYIYIYMDHFLIVNALLWLALAHVPSRPGGWTGLATGLLLVILERCTAIVGKTVLNCLTLLGFTGLGLTGQGWTAPGLGGPAAVAGEAAEALVSGYIVVEVQESHVSALSHLGSREDLEQIGLGKPLEKPRFVDDPKNATWPGMARPGRALRLSEAFWRRWQRPGGAGAESRRRTMAKLGLDWLPQLSQAGYTGLASGRYARVKGWAGHRLSRTPS